MQDLRSGFSDTTRFRFTRQSAKASQSGLWLFCVMSCAASVIGCAATPTSTPHAGLSQITSPSSIYTLRPLLHGWTNYPEGHPSYPDADLVLVHEESGVKALVYLERGAASSLDDYVAQRRTQIKQSSTIVSVEEERRFQAHSDFTPVSVSFFRVDYGGNQGWYPVVSAVVRGPAAIVEVFVSGGTYPLDMTMTEDLVGGLRFSESNERQR